MKYAREAETLKEEICGLRPLVLLCELCVEDPIRGGF
jgi:hypothetical protein